LGHCPTSLRHVAGSAVAGALRHCVAKTPRIGEDSADAAIRARACRAALRSKPAPAAIWSFVNETFTARPQTVQ